MDALEVLTKARALIESPEHWVPRFPTREDEACNRFCAARAIWKIRGFGEVSEAAETAAQRAYATLSAVVRPQEVPRFNDTHSHADVLAAFDKAIEEVRASSDNEKS